MIRALIREVSTGRSWQTDLQVNSGIHWVGVANAAKPTAEFVDQYVSGLRDALRHAGAL